MELRVIACFILIYFSVYALFWLFENRDSLLHAKCPANVKDFGRDVGASIQSCAMGLVGYVMKSFGGKAQALKAYPPPAQIWGATFVLFAATFLLTNIRADECFELLFWIYVGLLAFMIVIPLVKCVRR